MSTSCSTAPAPSHASSFPGRCLPSMLLVVLLAACSPTGPDEVGWTVTGTSYLEGVGLNPASAQPIRGVRVQLVTPPSAVGGGEVLGSGVSGADGSFTIQTESGSPGFCSELIRLEAQVPTDLPDFTVESVGDPRSPDCRGVTSGVDVFLVPDPFFAEEASADTGDCVDLPADSECLEYDDGFIWLVETPGIQGWRAGRPWGDQFLPTQVAVGLELEFHHVLNTSLVARVRLP